MHPSCFSELLWDLLFKDFPLTLPVEDTQRSSHGKATSSKINLDKKAHPKAHSVLKPRMCGSVCSLRS